MYVYALILLLLVASLGTAPAAALDTRQVTVESESVKIVFRVANRRLAPASLNGCGTEWLSETGPDGSIWRLAFQGPGSETVEACSAQSELAGARSSGPKGELQWMAPLSGGSLAAVRVSVRVDGAKGLSYWSLRVSLPAGWRVSRADFPVISNIRLDAGSRLAVPAGWGLDLDVKPGMSYSATYPSYYAAMQFVAIHGHGNGLYLAAHDPRGGHKSFSVKAEPSTLNYATTCFAAQPSRSGGTWKLPYEAVIGAFRGDCLDAARIYREFTATTIWGRRLSVSTRPIPQWLKDMDLWLLPGAEPLTNVDLCKRAADYFGIPIALHWYNWHQIQFDTLYPDYFPAKPGFAEGVKALREAGFRVMPYINGRICDPESRFWSAKRAGAAAAKKPNGELYGEVYASKATLNVMCPWAAQWQNEIAGVVGRLVNECGTDGVYVDQIGSAPPVQCHDPAHGHRAGGGDYWADGYRRMLKQIRAKLPRGAVLTTEDHAECWLDQFDAQLLVNTPIWEGTPIPLFPAVYSGRAIAFGFSFVTTEDLVKRIPFRAKMAQAFLWGSQLGWMGIDQVTSPAVASEAAFLRSLARCRRFAHQYVVTGRFLRMLDCRGDNPRLACDARSHTGAPYRVDVPTVMAAAWVAEKGKVGALVVNLSDEARQVSFDVPLSEHGIDASKGFVVSTYGSDGLISESKSDSAVQSIEVPAAQALVLSLNRR